MACPICKREFDAKSEQSRSPFCSERCKLIDLGRWLRGAYQIPVTEADEPETHRDHSPDDEADDV